MVQEGEIEEGMVEEGMVEEGEIEEGEIEEGYVSHGVKCICPCHAPPASALWALHLALQNPNQVARFWKEINRVDNGEV